VEGHLIDNAEQQRYELWLEDTRVGVIEYESGPGLVTLIHTEVDPSFEGRGFAGTLIASAIGDIRAKDLKLVPACSFVSAYLRRHPEDQDVLQNRPV
jgi:predicted GNAT family acetyltransferase